MQKSFEKMTVLQAIREQADRSRVAVDRVESELEQCSAAGEELDERQKMRMGAGLKL